MSTASAKLAPIASDRWADLCREYIRKLVDFGVATGSMPAARNPNRVELKKALLNATRGRSLTSFVQHIGYADKQHLKAMMHMECPVVCPNRRVMLPPVESMPRNVMRSAKKLRNFFGIPEAQVERDVPDLSDIAAVLIGVYSTCKLNLQGSELVVPQSSLKELPSVISVLDSLATYFQELPKKADCPRGDDKACKVVLQKYMKMKEMRKTELLKQKVFNMPTNFGATPAAHTYMTSFQRVLYNKLPKRDRKFNEDEDIWVTDGGDTTLEDDMDEMYKGLSKLNKAKLVGPGQSRATDSAKPGQIQELKPAAAQFRMEYETPIGSEVDVLRYDIVHDKFIQGVKVNAKGRIVIDLDNHVSVAQNENVENTLGLEAYRPVSEHKAANYAAFVSQLQSKPGDLSFLKRVQYSYQCQSSGDIPQTGKATNDEMETLSDVAIALGTKNN
ncbi:uncharacterized protein BcabD6B2_29420 [Babesia caballi]|uniref:Uncharacterized protein n=1 Tax=Babesia caballi TaxID=5871 RepID=A0AAV4LV73_BABCB|nr:hypothetical protein, conserved [Babesia caballi]